MKTLIVMRHGWAGESGLHANDDLRPLDARGRSETQMAGRALKFLFKKCDRIFVSPLVRSRQTADFLIKSGGVKKSCPMTVLKSLRPEANPRNTLIDLVASKAEVSLIVGHEPHLSKFLSLLLTDDTQHPLALKKGSVAVIDMSAANIRVLKCLITPSYLKKIKKGLRKE